MIKPWLVFPTKHCRYLFLHVRIERLRQVTLLLLRFRMYDYPNAVSLIRCLKNSPDDPSKISRCFCGNMCNCGWNRPFLRLVSNYPQAPRPIKIHIYSPSLGLFYCFKIPTEPLKINCENLRDCGRNAGCSRHNCHCAIKKQTNTGVMAS